MQIKSNMKNQEMKLDETKQEQEMRHQASSLSFIYFPSCFILKIGNWVNHGSTI